MVIKIAGLREGEYQFNFKKKVEEIGLAEPFIGEFLAKIVLQVANSQFIINTNLVAKANYNCDRCLEEFEEVINYNYKMVYLIGSEDENNESIDIKYIQANTEKIDIKKDVRDYLLLALPMKKLCSESCKGLCSSCGTNLNLNECKCETDVIDLRWSKLNELKN